MRTEEKIFWLVLFVGELVAVWILNVAAVIAVVNGAPHEGALGVVVGSAGVIVLMLIALAFRVTYLKGQRSQSRG